MIKQGSPSNLTVAPQSLLKNLPPNNDFDEVFYVVFVIQELDDNIVNAAKPFADRLTKNGRLTLIGFAEKNNLSPYYLIWDSPGSHPVIPKWCSFFWEKAYGWVR